MTNLAPSSSDQHAASWRVPRPVAVALGAFLTMSAAACAPPETDILATSSETTGAWDVTNAQENSSGLTADVCMSRGSSADKISDRLLLQLRNKGYQRIELRMIAGEDGRTSVRQVSWSPQQGKQMQDAAQGGGENPCAARNAANAPTNARGPAEGRPAEPR